jgi:hypothetical protein
VGHDHSGLAQQRPIADDGRPAEAHRIRAVSSIALKGFSGRRWRSRKQKAPWLDSTARGIQRGCWSVEAGRSTAVLQLA